MTNPTVPEEFRNVTEDKVTNGYMINITELDALEDLCRTEKIDGVIAPYLDVTQKPYQELCERMGYPCFGTREQHHVLTDKGAFKALSEWDTLVSAIESNIMF